ncbi:SAM-dependent methyltransferase [Leisingera aquaemixtae]|uniref:SAM-dependent methyltransferase n=1 Tax=Leisingera aquaemixtae TaxID=1396826 RepID=UPI0028831BB7|nr:SAM-dependent methyltransferase [Leisingera aquaemixtae]
MAHCKDCSRLTRFFDRLVDGEVLELAPPAAKRVFVGKHAGAHDWPQDRINAVILAEALRGRRVVRLKSGGSIFGRAAEEPAAARDAGIDAEIVPGITAACAAAALSRHSPDRTRRAAPPGHASLDSCHDSCGCFQAGCRDSVLRPQNASGNAGTARNLWLRSNCRQISKARIRADPPPDNQVMPEYGAAWGGMM